MELGNASDVCREVVFGSSGWDSGVSVVGQEFKVDSLVLVLSHSVQCVRVAM